MVKDLMFQHPMMHILVNILICSISVTVDDIGWNLLLTLSGMYYISVKVLFVWQKYVFEHKYKFKMATHAAVCQSDRDLAQFRLIGMSQTIISNVYLLLASDNQVQHTPNYKPAHHWLKFLIACSNHVLHYLRPVCHYHRPAYLLIQSWNSGAQV